MKVISKKKGRLNFRRLDVETAAVVKKIHEPLSCHFFILGQNFDKSNRQKTGYKKSKPILQFYIQCFHIFFLITKRKMKFFILTLQTFFLLSIMGTLSYAAEEEKDDDNWAQKQGKKKLPR